MDIVLTTLNAKYIHASFGLRYLLANMGDLRPRTGLVEFDINQRPLDIVEVLAAQNPRIVGFGVYIWNVAATTEVIASLKRLRPDLVVVVGGPEVSYEIEQQRITELADYIITGEADFRFGALCRELLDADEAAAGHRSALRPEGKVVAAELPDVARLILPYELYDGKDVAHRVIYVEASRGCPFSCEFCLSSLDIPVRQFPLPALLKELQNLLDRGVKQFKFVDRTFNLNLNTSKTLLEFFLNRYQPGLFFHFEMIPDRLPDGLREIIRKFPPGALQFEIGIQSFNPEVCGLISRRQDFAKLEDNLRFLRRETGVYLHTDLIVGLPGESVESFGQGFDRLVALNPHEIQVGMLKRLRGTPIVRHDAEWQMVYNPNAPYEILQNRLIDFATMQRLRRFSRYWDLVGNSGNFIESTALIWGEGSAFAGFMRFSDWLFGKVGRTDSIALARLGELLFEYLTIELGREKEMCANILWRDYQRGGRNDKPEYLRKYIADEPNHGEAAKLPLKRQARRYSQTAA
ncbi:MAG TPA: DUF4080 domain-containing protein [Verrucomicrobiae bacterium]|nr:DUF4080 domain-containing protein [Verrucomicrobiae bacterium]